VNAGTDLLGDLCVVSLLGRGGSDASLGNSRGLGGGLSLLHALIQKSVRVGLSGLDGVLELLVLFGRSLGGLNRGLGTLGGLSGRLNRRVLCFSGHLDG